MNSQQKKLNVSHGYVDNEQGILSYHLLSASFPHVMKSKESR